MHALAVCACARICIRVGARCRYNIGRARTTHTYVHVIDLAIIIEITNKRRTIFHIRCNSVELVELGYLYAVAQGVSASGEF